ncbi:MAG: GNAT family N-acetyltransferase [Lachnospiraceae bacterium]|nr:GNAT family N-acetyltransferase [Lachnospiraceae bacterium]
MARAYRGKGFTQLLLDRIIKDAKEDGYSYIEAYPFLDTSFAWQYHGPIPLYEKHGFQQIAEKSWFRVMQKKL